MSCLEQMESITNLLVSKLSDNFHIDKKRLVRINLLSIFFCFYILFPPSSVGQIIVSGDNFPQIGDTLLMAIDHLPIQIDLESSGPAKYWDFSSLQSAFATRVQVLPFSNYTGFSDLDRASARIEMGGAERYLSFQEESVMEHGRKVANPFLPSQDLIAYYEEPIARFRVLRYQDRQTRKYKAIAPLDLDKLVSLNRFKGIEDVKQARLVMVIEDTQFIDAWGRLRIPSATFPVLRQHVLENWSMHLETQDKFGNWKVVNPSKYQMEIPAPYKKEYYQFLSDEANGPIAIVNMTPHTSNIENIQYKSFANSNRIISNLEGRSDVFVYPNPTFDVVRFDLVNLPSDEYKIQIFNILGVLVKSYSITVEGYTTVQIDLSELKKGTYIYRLTDSRQNAIKSKRIVIIQP